MNHFSKRLLAAICAVASVSVVTISAAAAPDGDRPDTKTSRFCSVHNTVHNSNRSCNLDQLLGSILDRIDWDRLPIHKPGFPGNDCPETPDSPERPDPDIPEIPDEPEIPDIPDVPDEPEIPDVPDVPDESEIPDVPDVPDEPETPDTPDVPDEPETPDIPDVPDVPEQPDIPAPPVDDSLSSYARQVVDLVNEERAKAGLNALQVAGGVQSAAQIRAKEQERSFSHTRPNGSKFTTALTEAGVSFRGAGENIAYGQRSPQQVMSSWMNSSGHRANILNASYKYIGVGFYEGSNGNYYWSQIFTY